MELVVGCWLFQPEADRPLDEVVGCLMWVAIELWFLMREHLGGQMAAEEPAVGLHQDPPAGGSKCYLLFVDCYFDFGQGPYFYIFMFLFVCQI